VGVTGAQTAIAATAKPLVDRIRAVSSLPIALGFGISKPAHVEEVGRFADAAVVGSAIVQTVAAAHAAGADAAEAVERFVRNLKGR
jgi:tryptophan synthase alpha chain